MSREHDAGRNESSIRRGAAAPGDQALDFLATYDEGLRFCGTAEEMATTQGLSGVDLPPEELRNCLHLLERAWPRRRPESELAGMPRRIGRFEVERVLGAGGFGIVYLARDPALRRQVALKVPRLHSLADRGLRERFRREAYAVALLDHPHIVPIYETSEDGPVCYIATAYCPGPTLAEWLKQQTTAVPVRLVASLMACLADAVHYSHSHGVLHRDLKPGNVILVPQAELPRGQLAVDLPFLPRLTDFGLAKLFDEGLEDTTLSAALGTPTYMAPEQAGGRSQSIGPPADVYALGVILYELLVGQPPFVGAGVAAVLDQVRHDDPVPPRQLRREIPRDLETICLKCLEKSPFQRYETAQRLADDLRRFLARKPLRAKRPGLVIIAMKWVRRSPVLAALVITLNVVAIALPLLLVVHNQRLARLAGELNSSLATARGLRDRAEQLRVSAEESARAAESRRQEAEQVKELTQKQQKLAARVAYTSTVRLAEMAWREGDIRQCRLLLAAAARHASDDSLPGVEWHWLHQRTSARCRELGVPLGQLFCVAVSPDGQRIATGGEGGVVQVMDVTAGNSATVLHTRHEDVRVLAYSAKGDRLAVCGEANTISVWSAKSGECLAVSPPAPGICSSVTWLLNDRWIATGGTFPNLRLWRVCGERETADLSTNSESVTALTASRDGSRLFAGGRDGSIWIWDAANRQQLGHLDQGDRKISALAVSASGNLLAAGDNDHRVFVYGCAHGQHDLVCKLLLTDDIRSLAFASDDQQLAVLEQFGTLRLCSLAMPAKSSEIEATFRHGWLAHEQRGHQLAFLPGDSQLVSVGRGSSRPRLWSVDRQQLVRSIELPVTKELTHKLPLVYASDSRSVLATNPGPQRWSTQTRGRLATFGDERAARECLAISRDGRWLAAGTEDEKIIELWDMTAPVTDKPLWRLSDRDVDSLAFSPNGELLAVASWRDDCVHLLNRQSGTTVRSLPASQCHAVCFAPEGHYLAVDALDDVLVWDTASWQCVARLQGHLSTILTLDFSADGHWLASAGHDREIRLWSADGWKLVHTMPGHRADVISVRFAPDSRSLFALDANNFIKIWDVATGLKQGSLHTPSDGTAARFAISPDGRELAIRSRDGRIWLQPLQHHCP